jgi:hypothetical protein
MEDTANWLKNKIKPTETTIRSSGITTKEIEPENPNDIQETTEEVSPVIKKVENTEVVSPVVKKTDKNIIIPKVAVIGKPFSIDFDKEYSHIEVTISNGIRMEVPNAVWNANGEPEETGSPLIEFDLDSDTEKWSTVDVPIESNQIVHGKPINILKPEEILVQVYIKEGNEEHSLHKKIQMVEN